MQVDCAATCGDTALADIGFDIGAEAIVDRQLFALFDVAQGEVQNMLGYDAGFEVGFAAMVDEFGTAAADAAVDGPVGVEGEEVVKLRRIRTPLGLTTIDLLAGVLNHFAVLEHRFACIEAPAMDLRLCDLKLELGELGIDGWGCGHGQLWWRGSALSAWIAASGTPSRQGLEIVLCGGLLRTLAAQKNDADQHQTSQAR